MTINLVAYAVGIIIIIWAIVATINDVRRQHDDEQSDADTAALDERTRDAQARLDAQHDEARRR